MGEGNPLTMMMATKFVLLLCCIFISAFYSIQYLESAEKSIS